MQIFWVCISKVRSEEKYFSEKKNKLKKITFRYITVLVPLSTCENTF